MLTSNNPYAAVELQRMVIRPPTPPLMPMQSKEQPVTEEGAWASSMAPSTAQPETPSHSRPTTSAEAKPPPSLAQPESIDVSSLLGPDRTPSVTTTTTTGTRSTPVSNDTSSNAAPATPTTESDDTETDGEDNDADADTDDDEPVPVPGFLLRDPEADTPTDNDNSADDNPEEHDLAWADVAPPDALRQIAPDDIPEILREIAVSSIENVQAQLAVQVAAQAERAAAAAKVRAEAAEAVAKEAAQQKAAEEREKLLQMAQQEKQVVPSPPVDKGKGRDTATRHVAGADPVPPAVVKKSRRHFASRMLRHVHVLGGSSERGESSAAGAAAAAEAAKAAASRAALQRAYEEAMLRRYEPASKTTPATTAGPSGSPAAASPSRPSMAAMQRAYEEAMLRRYEPESKTTPATTAGPSGRSAPEPSSSTTVAVSTEMGTAPVPTQRRTAMLLAMLRKDMEKKETTIECISCFEDVPTKEAVKTVCHSYCLDCFQQLVATALDNEAQFPPKCCLNEVPAKTVNKYATHDLRQRYKRKADEFATPVADRVYCPVVDCGAWVPPAHIAPAARIARCRNGHETCTACRQPAHGRGTANREACPEASAEDQRDQQLADELAREEGWRHCIRCAVLVEHRDACQHMTCRCGAEFCYVCGRAWRTCDCDMEDLARVKAEADVRRVQRTAREARERDRVRQQEEMANAELADLRDALAQVAAFEQRERLRLRRVQQAQRARLQRLKDQREAALQLEIACKYARLRTVLAELNVLQATTATTQRRAERAALQGEHDAAHQQALGRQEAARLEAAAAAADTVRAAERHWQMDYRIRLALEAALEADYLRALVGDRAPADVRGAVRALEAYQRTNDARLDEYCAWRDRELAHARFRADEQRAVRDEVAAALVHKTKRESRRARQALAKRHAGERVWCRAVAAERVRLLAEMEVVEQGLGLAGSTSDADTNLLLLLELEAGGAQGDDDTSSAGAPGEDDTELSHLYAVMLAEAAGDIDEAALAEFGVDDDDDAWADDDHESFYSVYGGGGSNGRRSNNNNRPVD